MKNIISKLKSKNLASYILLLFVAITVQILISWFFVRFVHYDAQHKYLEPHTFMVQIISSEDLAMLSDKSLESVTLSDGTTFTDRQPAFYHQTLPSYKQVGDQYVRVTTIGTSHLYFRWLSDVLPLLLLALVGIVLATINARRQTKIRYQVPFPESGDPASK